MKSILLILWITIPLSSFASIKACKVYKTWLEGKSAFEICNNNGGSFCSTVMNKGQGICYGADGSFCSTVKNTGQGICYAADGSFCSTVENIAQGICYALDESFCSTMNDSKEEEMMLKLKSACNISDNSNIYN
jgi:hypothetical protein